MYGYAKNPGLCLNLTSLGLPVLIKLVEFLQHPFLPGYNNESIYDCIFGVFLAHLSHGYDSITSHHMTGLQW